MITTTIGSKYYDMHRAPIPTPEELARLAEAIRCAMADVEAARSAHREARKSLLVAERQLEEANEQLGHARAMLKIRAEGYDVVPQDETMPQREANP